MRRPSRRDVALLGAGAVAVLLSVRGFGGGDSSPRAGVPSNEVEALNEPFDPSVARLALDRLDLLRAGNAGSELSLTADELTAVVRHAMAGFLPPGVTQPVIDLIDGHVFIAVRVAAHTYPGGSPFSAVLDVLPDTLDVSIDGHLQRHATHVVLEIDRATAERVPIPRSLLVSIVAAIVRESPLSGSQPVGAGVEPTAELRLSWPSGIGGVEVVGDRLIVRRSEPFLERAVDGDAGV